jgi:hypothetical protein
METMDVDVDVDLEIVAMHGPFSLTKTGAVVAAAATPSYEQWQSAIEWCQEVEKASPFWVGDLLVFGDRFGEMASQVLEATGYAEQTGANMKHVCKTIPPERRRADVPFAHHQEIAALPTVQEQEYWLNRCAGENLTRDQLRVQIKSAKAEAAGKPVDLWLLVKCETVEAQEKLRQELATRGFSVKVTATEQKA